MPEGPEVRVICDQLNFLLKNTILKSINILAGPQEDFKKQLDHFLNISYDKKYIIKIHLVESKGKFTYIELFLYQSEDNFDSYIDKMYLGIHLGMTGNWQKQNTKHTLMILTYIDQDLNEKKLYFDDMRHFSQFYLFNQIQLTDKLNKLGPDILSEEFNEQNFDQIIHITNIQNRMIGEILIDQSIFSGIGNYLRADILYTAQLHPRTKIKNINDNRLKALYTAIKNISYNSYKSNGTTIKTYKDINMQPGHYETVIYGKEIDPLGNNVKKLTLGGRTVYYVPELQKI